MQVLCTPADVTQCDIQCPVCREGFRLYWERTSAELRDETLPEVMDALRHHHDRELAQNEPPHPARSFNVPEWAGEPKFSGAALLGGAY